MQKYCNIVKNKLNTLIQNMEGNVSAFVADPKRDFVRKSELSFSKTMKFILGMGSQTLGKELMEFYDYDSKMVSVSAIVQRRAKILPAAFQYLFHKLNDAFSQTDFFHGYRLLAVDGTDIHIPDDYGTHYCANDISKGYNLMHLNALYDLLNRRYMDAVLQDSRSENEHSALINMLENVKHSSIVIADRGYEAYNTIAHLENKGLKYVIRIKATIGIAKKFDIPADKETDFTADILLTRRQTKEVKSNPEKYRFINSELIFDFLPKGSKDTYPMKFRIIRIRISEGLYETIVTNLWDNEFSADDIKKIYKMRWGIETSFRKLKYHVGLIAFHSKKKDCVIQEIFASLIMYNFSMLITENILIDDDKHNDYRYKINYATAIHISIAFFRCSNVSPSNLEKLIARNKCPVRPDRNAVRKTRYHSAIGFNYRLS
ncbi:IS4 family transposase [Ruminococcus sp.]|uniref:IS4 family transposase n=1 Tax=Ruminococcus sp. TaxID=41978 RepID=UPI0025F552C3|nr:IS4 family transposase [Ruminococcus sp.]